MAKKHNDRGNFMFILNLNVNIPLNISCQFEPVSISLDITLYFETTKCHTVCVGPLSLN